MSPHFIIQSLGFVPDLFRRERVHRRRGLITGSGRCKEEDRDENRSACHAEAAANEPSEDEHE